MCLQTPSFLQCTSIVFLRYTFLHVTTTFTENDKYNASFKKCVFEGLRYPYKHIQLYIGRRL